MGKKRTGKGKYLFIYLACFLTVGSWMCGCYTFPKKQINFPEKYQGEQQLIRAKNSLARRDFSGASKKAEDILSRFAKTHSSEALFLLGLIYAHPDNPQSNLKKSSRYFKKLMAKNGFSESIIKDEVIVLTACLKKMIEKEDNKTMSAKQRVQIGDLNRQIKQLKNQIKKLKEIDLGIEEKKREVPPQK